jgi:hypothetical protein
MEDQSRVDKNRIIDSINNTSIKNILTDDMLVNIWGLDLLQEFIDYWSETDRN